MTVKLKEIQVFLDKSIAESEIEARVLDNAEQNIQLGGEPRWIQYDETPICERCNESMSFIGALPTTSDKLGQSIGDDGRLYVFYCFTCQPNAKVVMQCY